MVTMTAGNFTNEYRGLSTDTKPVTRVPNGSSFYEFDTVSLYIFDEVTSKWIKQVSISDGGETSLPYITDDDNGKVLTVVNGEWSAAQPEGGVSSLPDITDADNGKVLTVVDGEWVAGNVRSGSIQENREVIFGEYSVTPNLDWSCDPIIPGEEYIVTYDGEEYRLTAVDLDDGHYYLGTPSGIPDETPFYITWESYGGGTLVLHTPAGDSGSHTVKIEHVEVVSSVPNVYAEDDGKVLTVVNGEWVALPTGNEIIWHGNIEQSEWYANYPYLGSTSYYLGDKRIIPGEKYIVVYDGQGFEVTAMDNGNGFIILGEVDGNGMPSFENIPFLISDVHYPDQDVMSVVIPMESIHDVIRDHEFIIKTAIKSNIDSSCLPEVGANDDGKVLTVVNGEWVAANSQSGLPDPSESVFNVSFGSNEITSQGTPGGTFYYNATQLDTSSYLLIPGDQYIVTFNGVDYTITANNESVNHAYLGKRNDNGLGYDYEAYPFFIYEDGNHLLYVYVPEAENCTVDIKHILIEDNKTLVTKDGEWIVVSLNNEETREVIFDDTVSEYDSAGIAQVVITIYDPAPQPEDVDFLLIPGETYIVTYDGTEYEITAEERHGSNGSYLGEQDSNTHFTSFDNYPFYIYDDYQSYDGHLSLYIHPEDDSTSHDIKIEHVVRNNSSCLPDVTNSDNGKILMVVNGEWVAANPGSGESREMVYELPQNAVWSEANIQGQSEMVPYYVEVFEEELIPGDTYIITVDGHEYRVVSTVFEDDPDSFYYLGEVDNEYNPVFETLPFNIEITHYGAGDDSHIYITYEPGETPTELTVEHVASSSSGGNSGCDCTPCQYIEDGTGDYAIIENGIEALPSTGGYDPGTPKNIASGDWSKAEGRATEASGTASHAEGERTVASGSDSHAEGSYSIAQAQSSHAEGSSTRAYAGCSHAEGSATEAGSATDTSTGYGAHAEGGATKAIGDYSHSEGNTTVASGSSSHAEGYGTTANHRAQHVFGELNIEDPSQASRAMRGTYVEIVGNGTSILTKSNARTLDWNGNEVLAGKLTVGAAPTADMDVATKKYVDDHAGGGGALPSSATAGAFLVYDGTAWVAQTLQTWQGGSY